MLQPLPEKTPRDVHNSLKVLAERGSSRKRRGMKMETVEDRVEEAYQILRKMCERPAKDECSLYAELLAKKLRALDGNKREIVMHEISDLMFRAKMQNQNFRSLSSPYSSAPGGLHSIAPTYRPLSFRQGHSRISVLSPSSEPPLEAKCLNFTTDVS
jgi:hypothetical protein